MIRLNSVVEGQTELGFFEAVLKEHLEAHHVFVAARCVETSRKRHKSHRGGIAKYERFRKDLSRWIREDQNADARFTMMIDLYGLPSDFPGYVEAAQYTDPHQRVELLERRLAEDTDDRRFIPYIQLHEFEALLLCKPEAFGTVFINHNQAIEQLAESVSRFSSPELIDDGPQTSPSKRIIQHISQYANQKTFAGPIIAEEIGLPLIRSKCAHFDEWLSRLESLAT